MFMRSETTLEIIERSVIFVGRIDQYPIVEVQNHWSGQLCFKLCGSEKIV